MAVKVATTCLRWSKPYVPHSPTSSQTLASTVPSPPLRRRSFSDGAVIFRCVQRLDRSFWGTKLHRSRSCDNHTSTTVSRRRTFKQACSASLDAFSDEEFAKQIQEIATRFQLSEENEPTESESASASASIDIRNFPHSVKFSQSKISFDWTAEISEDINIIPANIEMKVNSVQLPHSLRIIRQKMQWEEGFREAGEFASCSVEKAFSSMVFIIHELHSFTLQMREKLFYEDLQGIILRVQKETQASFVWLFQQVFSHTPTLMMYVMILLANYSVYSMSANAAIAAPPPPHSFVKMESVITIDEQKQGQFSFDSSTIKKFSVSSSSGKTSSIGGSNGGGGKYRTVASGTDGDGESVNYQVEIPNGSSSGREEESVSGQEEEIKLWNSMVEEAARDTTVDTQRFVSPVTAEIDGDATEDYSKTELLYQKGLAQDPNNALLLANYAQFLYLVSHDYLRAEEYFKKATKVDPVDAEALNKYATFLWQCKNDLWAAEETYLDAISADPTNSYYAANYAHFLWNTGGEETCYPITTDDI
ncbi:uncharacterized protein LOC124920857 [Impatiens glandulifera]|uniref:uncharacterized protein LOC124920857 n=1 Tax=Impatiens glandulifera TaxID=253017 RepID=UPI001FB0F308|nr:uncharacterized protein LOC124920857 [Impatiens glandulifera]